MAERREFDSQRRAPSNDRGILEVLLFPAVRVGLGQKVRTNQVLLIGI